jgi:hypothetical protein
MSKVRSSSLAEYKTHTNKLSYFCNRQILVFVSSSQNPWGWRSSICGQRRATLMAWRSKVPLRRFEFCPFPTHISRIYYRHSTSKLQFIHHQWIVYAIITACWREMVTNPESWGLMWWTVNDTDHRLRPGYVGWHIASSLLDRRKYPIFHTAVLAAQYLFHNSSWNWHFPMDRWVGVIPWPGGYEHKALLSTGKLDIISFTSFDPGGLV